MEEHTRKRLDSVLEDELQKGYRIKVLPVELQRQLQDECGAAVSRVRFTRLNPSKRRKIAQVVQRQYHTDLQDTSLLSHEQILKLVQARGEWSPEMDEEMKTLQASTSREMGELFVDGMAQDGWTMELLNAASAFRECVEELALSEDDKTGIIARFDRWLEYTPDRRDFYTEQFAEEQGRPAYSPDFDMQRLMEVVTDITAIDNLQTIDDLRDKLNRYIKLQRDRLRLADLQLRQAKIFSDSVEQRRDNTEEMARLFFTTESVDEDGKPTGPVVAEFEKLWDLPEPVIQWFLVETYFFLNGIPDEAREYLQTFGFIAAEQGSQTSRSANGESAPSDESPAPQSSNPASNRPVVTESVSSDEAPATISTTAS